jgi:hypothetical protein
MAAGGRTQHALRRALALMACAALIFSRDSLASSSSGTAPLFVDGARLYVSLSYVRSDGTRHASLAFVDLGAASMSMSHALLQDLAFDREASTTLFLGQLPLHIDRSAISSDEELPYLIAAGRQVEAVLPAAILQSYQVVIDYGHRTLTLASPGTLALTGDAVPADVNVTTGLIAVPVMIAGRRYAAAIDPGSAYTWLKETAAREWVAEHPDWQRGVGAVGASNMRMADDGLEASGILLCLSELRLGSTRLHGVGALGVGSSRSIGDFIDWYSKKTPEPVVGFLGGNVLRDFRLSIDYPNRMTYWARQRNSRGHDLDQVGLTLARKGADYFVTAVVTRAGKPVLEGVEAGDALLQVGSLATHGARPSAVLMALHGHPGDHRTLVLERRQRRIQVDASVTEF